MNFNTFSRFFFLLCTITSLSCLLVHAYKRKRLPPLVQKVFHCHDFAMEVYNLTEVKDNFFQCDAELNATKCLVADALANATEECLDGFDESDDGILLQRVIQHAEKIQAEQAEQFEDDFNDDVCHISMIPETCHCNLQTNLYCTGSSFNEQSFLEFHPASKARFLTIEGSSLRTLNSESFRNFTNLKSLVVDKSGLSEISLGTFNGLSNLWALRLRQGRLKNLEPETFNGLRQLEILDLDYNELESLSGIGSAYLTSLQELTVRRNKITTIQASDFPRSIQFVSKIDLSHNSLSSVGIGAFDLFDTLTNLDLSYNRFSRCKLNDFAGTSVVKLNLANNFIAHLETSSFPLQTLRQLSLAGNLLTRFESSFAKSIPNTLKLNVSNNFLKSVDIPLYNMHTLVLSKNSLQNLAFLKLRDLNTLKFLDMSENSITDLESESLVTVSNLTKLSLSDNPVESYSQTFLDPLTNLQKLYLDGIHFDVARFPLLSSLRKLSLVQFKLYSYCRFASQVEKCSYQENPQGISSFYNLIQDKGLRWFVWIVAILTCLGNVLVICTRLCVEPTQTRDKTLPIVHLALADLMMGIYLFILAAKDTEYRDGYNSYALEWTNSWLCKVSGFLATTSYEQTVGMLCFMALERMIIIMNPFKFRRIRPLVLRTVCGAIWITTILLGLIPIFKASGLNGFYSRSDVCFPFYISNPKDTGWQYSFFLFVGINSLALVVIAACYACMFYNIYQTRKGCGASMKKERALALRLFIIVLTDALCWLPIIVLKIITTVNPMYTIDSSVHAWLVIAVVPINSAFNPWLYTFTTTNFTKRITNARDSLHTRLTKNSTVGSERHGPNSQGGVIRRFMQQQHSNMTTSDSFKSKSHDHHDACEALQLANARLIDNEGPSPSSPPHVLQRSYDSFHGLAKISPGASRVQVFALSEICSPESCSVQDDSAASANV